MLHELQRMKMNYPNIRLTKDYTQKDSYEDIEYELTRQKMNMETHSNVNFMRDMLRLELNGIELANSARLAS